MMLFNAKQGSAVDVRLGGATVRLAEPIVYLGIPIGRSMLETRHTFAESSAGTDLFSV